MADTKLSALTENSVPDTSDTLLWLDDTGPTSYKLTWERFAGLTLRGICQGRLTTETAVPISTSDRTAQSTLYWTPMDAGFIAGYDGTRWFVKKQAELSLALSGLTSGKNYDVFYDYNAGTPAIALGPAWTNDTTRATGLTTQDGIQVLSGTTSKRFLGTIRTTSTTTTEDSGGYTGTTQVGGKRFVWNYYNRVIRPIKVIDLTDSWAYTTDTIRQANGATGNKVEYVTGDATIMVEATVCASAALASNSANGGKAGVGLDSTSTFAGLVGQIYNSSGSTLALPIVSTYRGNPGLGYHFLSWNEKGADVSCTFTGDNGGNSSQAGLTAWIPG